MEHQERQPRQSKAESSATSRLLLIPSRRSSVAIGDGVVAATIGDGAATAMAVIGVGEAVAATGDGAAAGGELAKLTATQRRAGRFLRPASYFFREEQM